MPPATPLSRLRRILADGLGDDPRAIKSHSTFDELAERDSLDAVELIVFVEEKLGIEIPTADASRLRTVGELAHYLDERGVLGVPSSGTGNR